jgi:Rad3-related DNA helicase
VWVEKIDTRIVKDSYFQPQKGDCVLNFNYTTTIEDNFDTSDIEIIHIHGIINQDIVLKRQNNDFIVCNHDLLIANLKKINGYGTPLLADAPIIVIDEAHNLEDSARSQLTMQCCDFVEFFFVLF